jgi:uncharacterized membrane protein YdbT with pleckstrin-like domain
VAISRRLLNDGEHVVVSTRTHVKALLLPAIWLILVAAVAGYASSFPTGNARPLLIAVIWILALVVVLWLVAGPFLRWLTTTYTVTNRRLITRAGILARRGHDIPIPRINDVAYEHGIVDRLLGCGTLVISDASQQGHVRLSDIPYVERVHLQISEVLHGGVGRPSSDQDRSARQLDDGT